MRPQTLLVTGGYTSGGYTSSTEIYKNNNWTLVAPLPQARFYVSAATLDNSVFVFGKNNHIHCQSGIIVNYSPGGSDGGTRDDILRFIPANNTWMDAGKMTTPRHAVAVAPREISDDCS